jgi:hypothetical protein
MMSPYDTPQYHALKSFWEEPDIFDEEMSGFKVVARRNRMKAWCGYVGVPATHPLFGKGYGDRVPVPDRGAVAVDKAGPISLLIEAMQEDDGCVAIDVLFNVHGGITYSGDTWPVKDGLWYFGFDCSHCNDLTPQDVFFSYAGDIWRLEGERTYRSLDYVKTELASLAEQLEKMS